MYPLSHITSRFRLQRCLETTRPRLYRLAWSWCHDRHTAEDLVQATILRALQNLNDLRDAQKLEVWLTRILANLHRDLRRSNRNVIPLSETDLVTEDYPEIHAGRSKLIDNVRAGIEKLSDDQRMVLTLVDLMEFSYADVARTLDIPIGTVMSRLCRARKKLKLLLENQNRHDPRSSKLRRVK